MTTALHPNPLWRENLCPYDLWRTKRWTSVQDFTRAKKMDKDLVIFGNGCVVKLLFITFRLIKCTEYEGIN